MTKEKPSVFASVIASVVVGIPMIALAINLSEQVLHPEQREVCENVYKEVVSIKSAAGTGGLFGGSVCIYSTDKGDVSSSCGYDAGDKIYSGQECKWVTLK